ncbi:ABC transporter permease [Pseudonocardia sp. N23]|uniref:ABC transporter permease n=1 Tax=Pseudonocardia sp. N23 TaxID=1987376 RepID=UPI000C024003|nr:ABC transporter permease [Pseudonocardia sp. N23]GAY09019.1 serine phosphatase RsbU, regulator of sigma subunit [Pseudonocardia sp. N23]
MGVLLADARRHPGRVVLTGLAVLVAAFFAAGTLLLGGTLSTTLEARSVVTPASAAAVVRGGDLDAAAVAEIAGTPGVTDAVGVWSGTAPVGGAAGAGSWTLTSDPMTGPLTRLTAPPVAGRLPAADDEVLVSAATAARGNVRPGSVLTVGEGRLTVTGIVDVPGVGTNTIVATPGTVAALGGSLDQVDVAGADPAAAASAVRAQLPTDATVRTGDEQRAAERAGGSATATAVVTGVSVFTGLALVAAMVVVGSTFRILLTQRRTQLALLRCVGARSGDVVRAVLAEAAVSGLVAGVLGAAAAVGVGEIVVAVVGGGPLVVSWGGLAGCVLLAVVATVVAAVGPALAAGRTPPVAALGEAATGEAGTSRRGRRVVVATVAAVVALLLAVPALLGGVGGAPGLVAAAASGMATFAALVALGPLLMSGLAASVGRVVAAVGRAPGRMAVANAGQVPRRTAATVTVLTLGVGLTSALLVGVASVDASAQRSITERLPSAVQVTAADPPSTLAKLAAEPALRVQERGDALLVDPAPGVDDTALRAAVDHALGPASPAVVVYTADVRADLAEELTVLRGVGLGLVGMTVLVAIVGVGVTLTLSVTERTRETGLLRAVGLTRGGVRAMVAWEAACSALAAAVLGVGLGSLYGFLAIRALGLDAGAGSLPVAELATLAAGVVLVAVLAALAPAVRAGRVTPIRALTG